MKDKKYNPADDANYMSDSMVQFFKNKLLEIQYTLERRIKEATAIVTQKNDAIDMLDQAAVENERAMGEVNRNRDSAQLVEVRKAFVRLDQNEFGYCEKCGDDIGVKRLLFNPTFALCIECADLKEKRRHEYA